MDKQIILKPIYHRGIECIGIYFDIDFGIKEALKKTNAAKFSNTHKCWYTPLTQENYYKIYPVIKRLAAIDQSALHQYLADKKKKSASAGQANMPVKPERPLMLQRTVTDKEMTYYPVKTNRNITIYKNRRIHEINAHVLPMMEQQLKLKAYSSSTIRTYLQEMSHLLGMLKQISADDLEPQHLKRYLVYCYELLQLKENTLHSRINAFYPVGFKSKQYVLLCLCSAERNRW